MQHTFSYPSAEVSMWVAEPTSIRTNMTYDPGPQQPDADRPVIVVDAGGPSGPAKLTSPEATQRERPPAP